MQNLNPDLLQKCTRPLSRPSLSLSVAHRLRWIAGVISGFALALTAATLLLLNGKIATPVHAFSKQSRDAGADVFKTKGCEHCHGVDGMGTDRGPELQDIGKRWKKDHIEQQIRDGGGGMPPFGDALQPDEVKDLVDFLSARRKAPKKLPEATPPATPAPKPSPSDDTGI